MRDKDLKGNKGPEKINESKLELEGIQFPPGKLTFVPFSSTKRGALFFSGGGSDSLRHRQQKKLLKRPLLRGFFEEEASLAPGTN